MEKLQYDFLIVGAGWFGAICARELTNKGFKCLVIDKRKHIGGNSYTENIENIDVHKYGAHIFHTNDEQIWNYVNQLGRFNNFVNSPLAIAFGQVYNLPFNMNTFYKVWGISDPTIVKNKILEYSQLYDNPQNLEEQAISLVGYDLYRLFIKEYTEKQWGRNCSELPRSIIKRIPVRYTFDNNYFTDKYQGIPEEGYTKLFERLLNGIEVKLNTDYFEFLKNYSYKFNKTIYTGPIDRFYNYKFGRLNYRSLKFENQILETENYQGNAVVNYTTHERAFTRIIEHKHFVPSKKINNRTIITREYPFEYTEDSEPYYPIGDELNSSIYNKYKKLSENESNVIFGGRLAEYKYYDMHQVIGSALNYLKKYE